MNTDGFHKSISESAGCVIGIMFGYNEQDIIFSTIFNALKQGLHVYYVDDYSTDDTRFIVQHFFSNNSKVGYCMMEMEYRSNADSEKSWNLKRQLQFKTKLARTVFINYQWILHMDCDEVFQCPWEQTVEKGLLSLPITVGKVNCDVHDYFPATLDTLTWEYNEQEKLPMEDIMNFLTVFRKRNNVNTYYRFLRNHETLNLEFGHNANTFPNTVHTTNIIMHHFPYRSKKLAEKKVNNDRLPRISTSDVQSGVGWHYKLLREMELPIDISIANPNVIVNDGRYVTYFLKREK